VTEIRSFRRVFDLERRIYSIDTLRLNPGGVPVRGLAYFLTLLCSSLVASTLPLVGLVIGAMPWYLVDLAAPLAGAALLGMLRLDGRTFHLGARALLLFWTGPRRLGGLRRCDPTGVIWRPDPIVLLPDGSDGRMRRLRYTGPGAVLVACEHDCASTGGGGAGAARASRGWSRTLVLRALPRARHLADGKVIVLARGARLRVRGPRRRGAG
jgi:hypothetical protein